MSPPDRLDEMLARSDPDRAPEDGRQSRALLYAPPPAPAAPYRSLLEEEGFEVLVATDAAGADALLRSSRIDLVLAVAPTLSDDLRGRWRQLAPDASIRVMPGILPLLDEHLVPAGRQLEFTVRALEAAVGVAEQATGGVPDLVHRTVRLADGAAEELRLDASERAATRIAAVLQHLPDLMARAQRRDEERTEMGLRHPGRKLDVSALATALSCPFPVDTSTRSTEKALQPVDLAAAAGALSALELDGTSEPELILRQRARRQEEEEEEASTADRGTLDATAVEAVLAVRESGTDGSHTVLLVDGDVSQRTLLTLRLRNEGYRVRVARDGRQALEEVRRRPPDLILSEAVLPRLDGYGLLDALRREGFTEVPFLFLSSRSDPLSVNKGLLLGAVDFLSKPVNLEVLLTKLDRQLAHPVDQTEASSRIRLSDLTLTTPELPAVHYEELAPGTLLLGRFLLDDDLGEGGMGRVFRARDERLEEDLAIKVMKPRITDDESVLRRFKREIRLARRITHPNVVRLYDFWEAGPLKFLTMELLEGSDVKDILEARGPFPVPVALRIAGEIFQALAAAHSEGVIHRDVKSRNVIVLPSGRAKVLDFGIAQGLEPSLGEGTITNSAIGTPEYMSPEQVIGSQLDERTDLYSAGIVLWEMLTGRLPYDPDDSGSATARKRFEDPPPPSELGSPASPDLDRLVLRLLAPDREDRFASAGEVLGELDSIDG